MMINTSWGSYPLLRKHPCVCWLLFFSSSALCTDGICHMQCCLGASWPQDPAIRLLFSDEWLQLLLAACGSSVALPGYVWWICLAGTACWRMYLRRIKEKERGHQKACEIILGKSREVFQSLALQASSAEGIGKLGKHRWTAKLQN